MTPTDAARQLLALAERASPVPWKYYPATEDGLVKVQMGDDHVVDWDLEGTCPECFANMELIAHARNHGPDIARALLDAEARIADLEGALRDLLTWFPQKPSEPKWELKAGEYGADDAIQHARETLTPEGGGK